MVLVDIWEGTDPRPEVERFCELWGIEGTILVDDTAEDARGLGIRGVPANVLVGVHGIVREAGATELGELSAAVVRLLER